MNALADVRRATVPIEGGDAAAIVRLVGERRLALLGEASHGTHEFYALRAEATKRLIVERGFAAVVAEADWPDAYRVNRYVRARQAAQGAATRIAPTPVRARPGPR